MQLDNPNPVNPKSQNYRMAGVERDFGHHLVQTPAKAGLPKAGESKSHPVGVKISPELETLLPLWTEPSALSSSQ